MRGQPIYICIYKSFISIPIYNNASNINFKSRYYLLLYCQLIHKPKINIVENHFIPSLVVRAAKIMLIFYLYFIVYIVFSIYEWS